MPGEDLLTLSNKRRNARDARVAKTERMATQARLARNARVPRVDLPRRAVLAVRGAKRAAPEDDEDDSLPPAGARPPRGVLRARRGRRAARGGEEEEELPGGEEEEEEEEEEEGSSSINSMLCDVDVSDEEMASGEEEEEEEVEEEEEEGYSEEEEEEELPSLLKVDQRAQRRGGSGHEQRRGGSGHEQRRGGGGREQQRGGGGRDDKPRKLYMPVDDGDMELDDTDDEEDDMREEGRVVALHRLQPRRLCPHGCGAMVWPEEGTVCCNGGKHILGPQYNPPIDADYMRILQEPHMSKDSRKLNNALAMGTQGTYPSKALGGLAWHEMYYAHLALQGTTYMVMYGTESNNAFDIHLLPRQLLLDGAEQDLGRHYSERLLQVRDYLGKNHPLARRLCAIADMPGRRIDMTPYMRIEAQDLRTSAMELALVSNGVMGTQDRQNRVLYFDMRRHEEGRPPTEVHRHNALYDLLMFPMLHEKGVGGFFIAKDSKVTSTTGAKLTLQAYTRAMLFQNPRLHYLGRLAQEYALVQHSRNVEDTMQYQRTGKLQSVLKRRRDLNPRPDQAVAGSRVGLTASVVGSRK